MFGYDVSAFIIKEHKDKININHLNTCIVNKVNILNYEKSIENSDNKSYIVDIFSKYSLIVDAVFGYSFKYGSIKAPYDNIIESFKFLNKLNIPIVSLDVPSGWNVDSDSTDENLFIPDTLISIGVPKLCSKNYIGNHYIGGRFLPEIIEKKFEISLIKYEKYCDLDYINISDNQKEVF